MSPVYYFDVAVSLIGCMHPMQITVQDFKAMAQAMQARDPDASHWTFGG